MPVDIESVKLSLRKWKDVEYAKKQLNANRLHIVFYTALVVFVLSVYHLFSDGNFSFLLTLGAITHTFGFGILAFKIWESKSVAGISLKTLELYIVSFFLRLCSILTYEGYLPFDKSGDWLYQFLEVASFGIVIFCVFCTLKKFHASYNESLDVFGNTGYYPDKYGVIIAALPAFMLGLILHPSLNNFFLTDVAWTVALYIESVAILPQLVMFMRKGGEVEAMTSHYVGCMGFSRLFHFIFWVASYHELNDRYSETMAGGYIGYGILVAQILQLVIMGDFFYEYAKALKRGGPMLLPQVMDQV
eukprot:TRINITY_DN773996_c0_g1_i1.p1 TRINITY_DN773996_c0_g1~~TRINITY_DN773996_c0_g1_i1.p1  ORF type:complete len:303 (-),score=78.70 TRINITY_DN773996_c0_g1_i1:193-1101(-)